MKERALKISAWVLLIFWAVLVLFPFYWMVLTALKPYGAYNAEFIPKFYTTSPTLANFREEIGRAHV